MNDYVGHFPILLIIIPLFAGALIILLKEKRRELNTLISFVSVLAQLFIYINLLIYTSSYLEDELSNNIAVYLLGNWQSPIGIVLVADQLATLMLCLTGFLGLAALIYSTAMWNRVGIHFYSLFHFILIINGIL